MYYRRKILLSLFEVMGDELKKIRLQKLLFLLSIKQAVPSFDFVPYKFGCFSFQVNADLYTMQKYGQIEEQDDKWLNIEKKLYFEELKPDDQAALKTLQCQFKGYSGWDLILYTYENHPYFAINSTILSKVKKASIVKAIKTTKPNHSEKGLFTIGYEGISLESYLNKLIAQGIKALVDVRKNSRSMKYGFNKKQLKNACEGVHIAFYHFPELGIDSKKRKELNSQRDYDDLFKDYSKMILPSTVSSQKEIIKLITLHGRVALTCFEADICQCHRKPLAESIIEIGDCDLALTHI